MTMPQIPEYIVLAFSPTLNQTQRELNLMSAHPDNARDAQRWADSFATRLNDKQALRATDWVGRIEQVDANFHARTL
jgi:hypothetical protein